MRTSSRRLPRLAMSAEALARIGGRIGGLERRRLCAAGAQRLVHLFDRREFRRPLSALLPPGAQPVQHEAQGRASVVETPADALRGPRGAQAVCRLLDRLAHRDPGRVVGGPFHHLERRFPGAHVGGHCRHTRTAGGERGRCPTGGLSRRAALQRPRQRLVFDEQRAEVVRIVEGIRVARQFVGPERRMAGEPEDVKHLFHDGQHRALDRFGRRRNHRCRSDAANLACRVARDRRVPALRDEHTRAPRQRRELRRRRGMPEQDGARSVEQRHGDGRRVEPRPRRARGRLVECANEREDVGRRLRGACGACAGRTARGSAAPSPAPVATARLSATCVAKTQRMTNPLTASAGLGRLGAAGLSYSTALPAGRCDQMSARGSSVIVDLERTIGELAPRVLRYTNARLGDPALAEDVAQESLAALVRACRNGAPRFGEAFVFAIARSRAGGRRSGGGCGRRSNSRPAPQRRAVAEARAIAQDEAERVRAPCAAAGRIRRRSCSSRSAACRWRTRRRRLVSPSRRSRCVCHVRARAWPRCSRRDMADNPHASLDDRLRHAFEANPRAVSRVASEALSAHAPARRRGWLAAVSVAAIVSLAAAIA